MEPELESPKTFSMGNSPQNIFNSSSEKFQTSRLSQQRYSLKTDKQNFPEGCLSPIEEKHLYDFTNSHRRRASHQRTISIYIPYSQKMPFQPQFAQTRHPSLTTKANSKGFSLLSDFQQFNSLISTQNTPGNMAENKGNLSDADSVVYLGPSLNQSLYKINQSHSSKQRKDSRGDEIELPIEGVKIIRASYSSLRQSLPVLGVSPTAFTCSFCQEEVHTTVEYCSVLIPSSILKFIAKISTCCRAPDWLSHLRVHKCPRCSLVLAKSRQANNIKT